MIVTTTYIIGASLIVISFILSTIPVREIGRRQLVKRRKEANGLSE
jgi:uncharacterized membrane protein (DUF485 family)